MTLGQAIKKLRTNLGWSRRYLEERANAVGLRLPTRTLTDIEIGRRKDPRISTLKTLSILLMFDVAMLGHLLNEVLSKKDRAALGKSIRMFNKNGR